MEVVKICMAAFVAVSVMTAFSQYVSQRFSQIFKEPLVLGFILSRPDGNRFVEKYQKFLEQSIRYVAGLLIVLCYHFIWTHADVDPTWFSGLIFGIFTGLGAIFYWFFLFRLSSVPKVRFKEYYLPLFATYILFGLAVIVVYRLFALFE